MKILNNITTVYKYIIFHFQISTHLANIYMNFERLFVYLLQFQTDQHILDLRQ